MNVPNNEQNKPVAAESADLKMPSQLHNSRYRPELNQIADIRTTILVQSPRGGQTLSSG